MSVAAALAPATAPVQPAVEFEALALSHRYGRRIGLEPLDFVVSGPAVVAVTGANGSGKSTLLRILAGLLRPSRGESRLRIGGTVIPPAARRERVAFAGPELAFYEELTALENLAFAAEARGVPQPSDRARDALAHAGLSARADDRVAALSSGMIQRLRMAFALLDDPVVVLLDEPSSHLDEEGRAAVEERIAMTGARCLVIVATNDEREWRLATRRIELRGRGLGHPA